MDATDRLNARVKRVAGELSERPGDSFPDAFPDESQLEAVSRFVNNDRVTLRKMIEPHAAATLRRAKAEQVIIVAHDTTGFRYEGSGRRGLGRLLQRGSGFHAHMALAVTRDEVRDPLGILAVATVVRVDERTDKMRDRNAKVRGCALEKRQLETLDALLNALGLFIPIAWNLLRLRALSRQEQPETKVLIPTQLKVLRASSKKKLPAHLFVRDAMLAIAKLGGHLKRSGDPSWITLGRGNERLLVLERVEARETRKFSAEIRSILRLG